MRIAPPGRARSLPPLALACLALGFATALAGCGSGEEESGSTGAEASALAKQKGSALKQAEEAIEGEQQDKEPSPRSPVARDPKIATERTPGSKAVAPGVPTTKGGDNSIQAFGLEGETDEAAQAAANLRTYLSARVDGDWVAACAAASGEYREQLETMVKAAKGKEKPEGCAEILELLFGKVAKQALEEAAAVEQVLSFRVKEDGYAYLIYEAGDAVKFIAMANEEGTWKVNVMEPTPFPGTEAQGSTQ